MSTKQRRKTQRRKQKQSQEAERQKLIGLLKPGSTPYNAARFDSMPIEALRRLYMSERQRFKARHFATSPYMMKSAPLLLSDSLADIIAARSPPTINLTCIDESHYIKHDAEASMSMSNFVDALHAKLSHESSHFLRPLLNDLRKIDGVDRVEIDSTSDPQVIQVTSGESKCS